MPQSALPRTRSGGRAARRVGAEEEIELLPLVRERRRELVDEPGPATLALDIRVEDIVTTVAPSAVGRSGRAAALLEASSEAVIVIELRDSQSNAILARAVSSGSASGGALRTPEGELRTRFESSAKVVDRWAAKTRTGLERLLDERR